MQTCGVAPCSPLAKLLQPGHPADQSLACVRCLQAASVRVPPGSNRLRVTALSLLGDTGHKLGFPQSSHRARASVASSGKTADLVSTKPATLLCIHSSNPHVPQGCLHTHDWQNALAQTSAPCGSLAQPRAPPQA
eukprot:364580-Chlamydomonas_euryale.AAC.3